MIQTIKVKDLPILSILWHGENIIGVMRIKGTTIPRKYFDYECYKLTGNRFDYELIPKTINLEKGIILKQH